MGLLEQLLPGAQTPEGILSPADVSAARSRGLLHMGAAMLEAGGPSHEGISLGQGISRGLLAGEQGMDAATQQMSAQKMQGLSYAQMKEQLQQKAQMRELMTSVGFNGSGTDEQKLASLEKAAGLALAQGNHDLVTSIASMTRAIHEKKGQQPNAHWVDGVGGRFARNPVTAEQMNDASGKPIMVPYDPSEIAARNPGDMTQAQKNRGLLGLRASFHTSIAKLSDAADAYRNILVAQKTSDNPMSATNALYSYARLKNPGSVVRAGDINGLKSAASLPDRFKNAFTQMTQGHMSKELMDYIVSEAHGLAASKRESYNTLRGGALESADMMGFGRETADKFLDDHWRGVKIPGYEAGEGGGSPVADPGEVDSALAQYLPGATQRPPAMAPRDGTVAAPPPPGLLSIPMPPRQRKGLLDRSGMTY